jgi:hypothetical protein
MDTAKNTPHWSIRLAELAGLVKRPIGGFGNTRQAENSILGAFPLQFLVPAWFFTNSYLTIYIGCLNAIVYIISFYTYRGERRRIISARQAGPDEQEEYHDYFKKIIE